MKLTSIPLFPLPICLMPGGRTELRIFEQRYKRLVSEASNNLYGFGLCLYQHEQQIIPGSGCLARIIDFEQLPDGLLGITIEGTDRFQLDRFVVEEDGLKRGEITLQTAWPASPLSEEEQHIARQLQTILEQHQPKAKYSDDFYKDITWVCQRWLEILPIDLAAKHQLMMQADHQMTLDLLQQLIE
ncbi:LON peptidase substrate-binding domain-containing protein [Shewanella avicenniae]|uniref:LON peptidase substrate-binding domain-containing protein n=1 Tax=Shewanella avicenniae TaxID=2814294 RepID=A0ABX7QVQ8_9GAMM|nr:LON peptidase substrate-binding domain-containing protein [Shewanella avicenniae]QSX35021.1 LON peptidase substrate-binding domain-containing protein [Shewanella avicenniae]